MRYQELKPIRHDEAERILADGNPLQIQEALLRIALHDPDWVWAQTLCLKFLHCPDTSIQIAAIKSLGHLARIHGVMDLQTVEPILLSLKTDRALLGAVEDTLDDIKMFASSATHNEPTNDYEE